MPPDAGTALDPASLAWAMNLDTEPPVAIEIPPGDSAADRQECLSSQPSASCSPQVRVACICQSGFTEVPWRGTGIGAIHAALGEGPLRDRVLCPLLALEPWDADTDTLVEKTVAMVSAADLIIHVSHSYGSGQGLHHYARGLAKIGRYIDFAIMLDPVVRYPVVKWRALKHDMKFEVPDNVRNVATFRTLHVPPWSFNLKKMFRPVGHGVVVGLDTGIIQKVIYGTPEEFAKWPLPQGATARVRDAGDCPTHTTIDELPEVKHDVIALVSRFLSNRQEGRAA